MSQIHDGIHGLDLYELLPAVYRLRDAERGYPLRAVMGLISDQAAVVKRDLDGLWDDFFIETCAEWVIPYLADLVGNNPLHEVAARRRADVAKTIYYRRRKGTLPMLEELARDVTGWGAHAVESFEMLGWVQNLNHPRRSPTPDRLTRNPDAVTRVGTVNLRHVDALDRLEGPFDEITHTVDLRPPDDRVPRHNLRRVLFCLWRLFPYTVRGADPAPVDGVPGGYHFSPLGQPAPVFTKPRPELAETGLADEIHVPGPIRPLACVQRPHDYSGDDLSFALYVDGALVPPEDLCCRGLADWESPPAGRVAVDVTLGRILFDAPPEGAVTVDHTYGFSADLGGGPYDRRRLGRDAVVPDDPASVAARDMVADPAAWDALYRVPGDAASVGDAVAAWVGDGRPRAVIQIDDSRTRTENVTIELADGLLVLQAANLTRPVLIGNLTIQGGGGEGRFGVNGLTLAGQVTVEDEPVEVRFDHCTLVPGLALADDGRAVAPAEPSVVVIGPSLRTTLTLDHTISGPLRLPATLDGCVARDSILDSPRHEPPATLLPVLLSGNLAPWPGLTSAAPTLNVSVGGVGPVTLALSPLPTSLAEARDALQAALQAADNPPLVRAVRVQSAGNRLVLLPDTPAAVVVEPANGDPTAAELRLTRTEAETRWALRSSLLEPYTPPAGPVELAVTIGPDEPRAVTVAPPPATLAALRDALQQALRDAATDAGDLAWARAQVAVVDGRLVVLPGVADLGLSIEADDDAFGLRTQPAALAADAAGVAPGPPTTLERVTVFGPVHVTALTLASEVLFTAPVIADRRQNGCVRFSHVPRFSQVPRRYRCQPDLALAARAVELGLASAADLPPDEAERVRTRVAPAFTDDRYGRPAYAQLGPTAALELRSGAEDGAELGAFQHLRQPQREANLRLRLEEYLPFGLEPGLVYIT